MTKLRLTETELVNLIKRVITEQPTPPTPNVGYPGGVPCYACINNAEVTILFPQNAVTSNGECAPTGYGYAGTQYALPGGSASYNYPSIWSTSHTSNCGGTTSGSYFSCYGCENGQIVASGTCPQCNPQAPLASWVNPNGGGGTIFNTTNNTTGQCSTIGGIPFYQLPSQVPNCGGSNTQSCNKECTHLVPSGFPSLIANKQCNWLDNRWTAFTNKLATKTPGSCQHKRIECKMGLVKERRIQLGCSNLPD